jgi:hypothetical protein
VRENERRTPASLSCSNSLYGSMWISIDRLSPDISFRVCSMCG